MTYNSMFNLVKTFVNIYHILDQAVIYLGFIDIVALYKGSFTDIFPLPTFRVLDILL